MVNPEDQFLLCNKRQSILKSTDHLLILGGPGSGKTTIGILKARRAVLENLNPEQTVLFLSFSNSAIRRILASSRTILTPEILSHINIKTYHSFAWDILRSNGYLLSSHRQITIVATQDAAVIRAGLDAEKWRKVEPLLFLENGRLTYDQFAPQAAEILERSSVIRKRLGYAFPLILVDEFQDTDEHQWRLIKALAQESKLIALGDTHQRIYSWRKGVSPTRLQDFSKTLGSVVMDFENENNRSPSNGITGYARDLLSSEISLKPPNDIEFRYFTSWMFPYELRFSLFKILKETFKRKGSKEISVVIAARSRLMVRLISKEMEKTLNFRGRVYKPISHNVLIDQVQITLAARVVAFILESKNYSDQERFAGVLVRIGEMFRSSGNKTGITKSNQLSSWAEKCLNGNFPRTKCVKALSSMFQKVEAAGLVGSPTSDWQTVLQILEISEANELKRIGENARYMRIIRRGSAIESQLCELWKEQNNYLGVEAVLEAAIIQDQLMGNSHEKSGISVMTMHQLKGREYDAVLIVENKHNKFLGKEVTPPFMETRRLLHVSLTRARHFVCVLAEQNNTTFDILFTN